MKAEIFPGILPDLSNLPVLPSDSPNFVMLIDERPGRPTSHRWVRFALNVPEQVGTSVETRYRLSGPLRLTRVAARLPEGTFRVDEFTIAGFSVVGGEEDDGWLAAEPPDPFEFFQLGKGIAPPHPLPLRKGDLVSVVLTRTA